MQAAAAQKSLSAFIDANIYLSFYAYPASDLKQLSKIPALIKGGALSVFVTEQVSDEISRNREVKIADCIKDFSKHVLSAKIPPVLSTEAEAKEFYNACEAAVKARAELIKKFRELAAASKLEADIVISEIIRNSKFCATSDVIRTKAIRRFDCGNPPGKNNSKGDQLNWETLLATCPNGDLYIIAADSDYRCVLEPNMAKRFLRDEWKRLKGGELYLNDDIGAFLNSIDPKIKLVTHPQLQERINNLVTSYSFAQTHLAISALEGYKAILSDEDVKLLAQAVTSNSQIRAIYSDSDVHSFYRDILSNRLGILSQELRDEMKERFF